MEYSIIKKNIYKKYLFEIFKLSNLDQYEINFVIHKNFIKIFILEIQSNVK